MGRILYEATYDDTVLAGTTSDYILGSVPLGGGLRIPSRGCSAILYLKGCKFPTVGDLPAMLHFYTNGLLTSGGAPVVNSVQSFLYPGNSVEAGNHEYYGCYAKIVIPLTGESFGVACDNTFSIHDQDLRTKIVIVDEMMSFSCDYWIDTSVLSNNTTPFLSFCCTKHTTIEKLPRILVHNGDVLQNINANIYKWHTQSIEYIAQTVIGPGVSAYVDDPVGLHYITHLMWAVAPAGNELCQVTGIG